MHFKTVLAHLKSKMLADIFSHSNLLNSHIRSESAPADYSLAVLKVISGW